MIDRALDIACQIPDVPSGSGPGSRVEWSETAHEFRLYLSREEWDALRTVLLSLKLSNILEQQRMVRAFPKLVNAVKLILAVEEHAESNPTETVRLAKKTREQLKRALVIAGE